MALDAAKFSAQALAEMVVQRGGEAAWNRSKGIWQTISTRCRDDRAINGATLMLAEEPEYEKQSIDHLGIVAEISR